MINLNLFRFIAHGNFKDKFRLPTPGEKVGFSDALIKEGLPSNRCFRVTKAIGHVNSNIIFLHCSTVLKTGEWKILPIDTPINT